MKTRTLLIPAAFAGTAVFASVPESARAAVAEPIAVSSNALVADLDLVVGIASGPDAVLGGQVVAMTVGVKGPTVSRTCPAVSTAAKNAKLLKLQTKTCPTSSGPAKLQKANGTAVKPKPTTVTH